MKASGHARQHAATLQRGMQHHQAGRLDQASLQYQAVLKTAPRHPDALHLLGMLEAQRGRHAEAAVLIQRAIAVRPLEAMFHNNLGNVQVERHQPDAAEASYRRALALDAGRADACNNLGIVVSRRGDAAEAEALLLRAIELAPTATDARENLANHYLRQGRQQAALEQCTQALVVKPGDARVRLKLGQVCSTLGRNDQAATLYRALLADEPDNAEALYMLQACTGEDVPDRAPDGYVARTFDAFAASFDAKLAALSYLAPELVALAVARHVDAPARQFDTIDAGCGTGLCGPLLLPWARTLVGVDLSAGMLRQARLRQLYDVLEQAELVAFLAVRPGACDLLVAADTLCYFGALEAFAAAARQALRPGGWLVFTVEAAADDAGAAFALQPHGRYRHQPGYVASVLRAAGLAVVEMQTVVLRQEAGQAVDGLLLVARAGPAG